MKLHKGWTLVLCLLVATLFVASTFAQETTAGLQGTIRDAQGAVISGATIEVSSNALQGVKKSQTDASGYYRFANLPPGTYTITIIANNFRTMKQTGINLTTGALPTIDLKLEVGAVEQTIEVSSAAPIVDVTQSKVQTNVTSEEIAGIPKGRSYQSVIQLAPGARVEPLMGNGYQIDGASNAENTYLVEGQDTGNVQTGFSAANVPFEFVQEVQVKSGGFEAEYGGALGGVVNVIQKRGGNAWHGSVVNYFQGDNFNDSSSNPTAAVNSTTRYLRKTPNTSIDYGTRTDRPDQIVAPVKDHYRIVEPGFEAGGYFVKDRLWTFASFMPRISNLSRTVKWAYPGNTAAGIAAINGPRTFHQDTNTYYSLARVDYLLSQKIRVYGAWQYQYERQSGNALPNADDAYGLSNTTNTQAPDNFNYGIGYVAPNVMYNTGADITITPSLVATTRFGFFFTDFQNRGIPEGIRYRWIDVNYPYPSISTKNTAGTASVFALHDSTACVLPGPCAPSYGSSGGVTPLGDAYLRSTGFSSIGANFNTFYDKYWRKSFTQDLAYFKKGFMGTHNFKGGYALNKLSNDVFEAYNPSQVYLGYGRNATVAGVANQANCAAINAFNNANYGTHLDAVAPNRCGGLYGTINLRDFQTSGKVGSNNHALYLQDAWTLGNTGVTLNLGLRVDREALPNYFGSESGFTGIDWGFSDKLAPRLGGAWDLFRNGKFKVYGSFGYFYDIMKYELPRGSFGGDYWHDCIYALDNPDYTQILPTRTEGPAGKQVFCNLTGGANGAGIGNPARPNNGFIANLDFRAPSNSVDDYRIDPNLKPMKQHESTMGADWAINSTFGLETRWTRKRLDRTIEDAGYIDSTGSEPFYIVNPGEGIHKASGLVPATDCPTGECGTQPKAVRQYDGLEFRLTKKASARWFGVLSYTYSRLYGNYSGLTSSDSYDGGSGTTAGGGRASPNVSRNFDEPFMQFTSHGVPALGRLATDRPHTFKGYGYYRLKWWNQETLIGGTQLFYSGTPLGSYMVTGGNAFAPQFVEGRDKWVEWHRDATTGDLVVDGVTSRRTPMFSQTDLSLSQEFKVSKSNENLRLGVEANVVNIFNQHSVVSYATQIGADNEVVDPQDHTPVTSQSGVDYPSLTHYGYNYADTFNGPNPANLGAGVTSASYGRPNLWQNGRTFRFKLKFVF